MGKLCIILQFIQPLRIEMENFWASNPKILRHRLLDSRSLAVLCSYHMRESSWPTPTQFLQSCFSCENLRQDPICFPRDSVSINIICLFYKINITSYSYYRIFTSCIFVDYLDSKSEGTLQWVAWYILDIYLHFLRKDKATGCMGGSQWSSQLLVLAQVMLLGS